MFFFNQLINLNLNFIKTLDSNLNFFTQVDIKEETEYLVEHVKFYDEDGKKNLLDFHIRCNGKNFN